MKKYVLHFHGFVTMNNGSKDWYTDEIYFECEPSEVAQVADNLRLQRGWREDEVWLERV